MINNEQIEADLKELQTRIRPENKALIEQPLWNWQEAPIEIRFAISYIGASLILSPLMIEKIQEWSQGNAVAQIEQNPKAKTKISKQDQARSERIVLNLYDIAKVASESQLKIKHHPENHKGFSAVLKKIALELERFEKDYVAKTSDIQALIYEQQKNLVEPVFNTFVNAYLELAYYHLKQCAPGLSLSQNDLAKIKQYYPKILFAANDWNINQYYQIDRDAYYLYVLAQKAQANPESDAISKFKHLLKLPEDQGIRCLHSYNFNLNVLEKNINNKAVWKDLRKVPAPADGIYVRPELIPTHWKKAISK